MPPEIINHQDYDSKVDVWSAGVVTYVLLSGKPPFFGNNKEQVNYHINHSEAIMDKQEWYIVSNEAKDFIKLCLIKDPAKRPSAHDMLNHQWLKQAALIRNSKDKQQPKKLSHVSQNLQQFCLASDFQKTVISILAGLRVQADELRELRKSFMLIDSNQDGTLSLDELKAGLGKLTMFELFQNHQDGDENCITKIMDQCDLDGDGKLDSIEFI